MIQCEYCYKEIASPKDANIFFCTNKNNIFRGPYIVHRETCSKEYTDYQWRQLTNLDFDYLFSIFDKMDNEIFYGKVMPKRFLQNWEIFLIDIQQELNISLAPIKEFEYLTEGSQGLCIKSLMSILKVGGISEQNQGGNIQIPTKSFDGIIYENPHLRNNNNGKGILLSGCQNAFCKYMFERINLDEYDSAFLTKNVIDIVYGDTKDSRKKPFESLKDVINNKIKNELGHGKTLFLFKAGYVIFNRMK